MARKKRVRIFVSYARANARAATSLMDKFSQQVGASRFYEYFIWQDWKIFVGEDWREAIDDALEESQAGLLLVSPAFLRSSFIGDTELPALLGHDKKAIFPVMLQSVDFERHDLRGLEEHQIFVLQAERFKAPKSYGDCDSDNLRDRFALALFGQVDRRLDKLFGKKRG